jgi:hypothetical protein
MLDKVAFFVHPATSLQKYLPFTLYVCPHLTEELLNSFIKFDTFYWNVYINSTLDYCDFFGGHLNVYDSKSALEHLGQHGTFKSRSLWSIRDGKGLKLYNNKRHFT